MCMAPVRAVVSSRRRIHFHGFGVARQGSWITVEKVGVGPVGGPREPEIKTNTLRKRRIRPLSRGQKRAQRGFSTGCRLLGSPPYAQTYETSSDTEYHSTGSFLLSAWAGFPCLVSSGGLWRPST